MGLKSKAAGWAWRKLGARIAAATGAAAARKSATATRAKKAAGAALAAAPPGTIPTDVHAIAEVVKRCRAIVKRRSLVAAGVAVVPVPGLDWVADIATLTKLIGEINEAFGLTPAQVERLAPERRVVVYRAISAGGGLLVGRLVTRDLVIRMLKLVGVRLTAQQAAKWVPVAGQALSAALTYSSLKYVADQHIRQCADVAQRLALPAPAAAPPAA